MSIFVRATREYPDLHQVVLQAGAFQATVIPQANMVLSSFMRDGTEILGQRDGLRGYRENLASFAMPFMAPWINRLSTTEYDFDGQHVSYRLERMKVDENGYAMHGLLTAHDGWEWQTLEYGEAASVRGIYHYDERTEGFPSFPFRHHIELRYILSPSGLDVFTLVENLGDGRLPVAFGFHPHFNGCDNLDVDGVIRQIRLNAKTIPVDPTTVGPEDTDHTAWMCKMHKGWTVGMDTSAGRMHMVTDGYPFLLIWSPPNAGYRAVEPMMSNIDPFNTEVTSIGVGERYTASFTLSFPDTPRDIAD